MYKRLLVFKIVFVDPRVRHKQNIEMMTLVVGIINSPHGTCAFLSYADYHRLAPKYIIPSVLRPSQGKGKIPGLRPFNPLLL